MQYEASGYSPSLLTGPILPPATANESLSKKPFAQQFYQKMVVGNLGPSQNLEEQTAYINFYANLIKQSDAYLVSAAPRKQRVAGDCRGGCWLGLGLERVNFRGEEGWAPCGAAQPPLAPLPGSTTEPFLHSCSAPGKHTEYVGRCGPH
jgi:hypothetical protein